MKVSAYAKVTVTLEITANSSWGSECAMSQIHKQAGEEVINQIQNLINKRELRATIIGVPKVLAVMASIDKE